MPFMTNGRRDYRRENELYNSKPEQRKARSQRTVARTQAVASGRVKRGDGKDLAHIKAISKGGSTNPKNLRVSSASSNRSFQRNADGSMKSETSTRERKRKKKK